MESNYDENLTENSFLQCLIQEHSLIYKKAVQESWIICVPRCGNYHNDAITSDDISAHILMPDMTKPDCAFQSLGGRGVECKERLLIVRHEEQIQTSRLLFEETFYSDDLSKYTVWCIDKPLTPTTSDLTEDVVIVENLADCMNFLYTSLDDKSILKDMDTLIETFKQVNTHIEKETLFIQRNLVESLYLECLEKILSDKKIQENVESRVYLLRNIKISVESYVLYELRNLLPAAVSANTAAEDAELNKKIKNLHELQLQDLDIRDDIEVSISRGKLELSKLYSSVTVLGKVGCLKRTTRHIMEGLENISTDDLLPILIFIVIRTGLPDWTAQLMFMKQFRFSSDDDNANDEVGFLITTLEAAVEHVKSGGLSICQEIRFLTLENANNPEETNPTVLLNRLFTAVKDVDLEEIERIISSKKQGALLDAKLCHPLCTCSDCEKSFMESKLADTSFPNVNSKDERGRTPLQIASIFGHVTVVEFLLIHEADPSEQDNDGLSALHFAACRGHQDTVLLLLHANADPTAFDAQGNTPLHLAADNGHTSCAKAILYFSEQRRIPIDSSAANIAGDTPLHHASKWGYMTIVEILLEHRANPRATNRRGQTPLTVAHSSHIIRKLENPSPIVETILQVPLYRASEIKRISRIDNNVNNGKNEKNNKADKLLAAINQGDVRLACFYLGLEGPQAKTNDSELPELCHPLCTCEKCAQNDEPIDEDVKKSGIGINIHNSRGETALHVASANGLTELVQILIDAGANVNAYTSYEHRTPLHIACTNDKIKVVKIFLNCRTSNVNAKDLSGDTPLHLAVKNGNVRIIELLLRHGADVHQRNYNNLSSLELIQEIVSKDVFSSLVYNNILKIMKSQVAIENIQRKENI